MPLESSNPLPVQLAAPLEAVRIVPDVPRDEWDSFVTRQQASFYHLYDWQKINAEVFGHRSFYLGCRRGDTLTGILPLTLLDSALFGRILCSVPFLNYGGPVAIDAESLAALIGVARATATTRKARFLELRSRAALPTDLTVSLRKVSMTLALDPDPEKLWAGFSSKHRTAVRRAQKNGLEVQSGGLELLDTFYDLMVESWHRLGTPIYSKRYFERILATFPDETRIFICRRGAEPIATAFNGYFGGTVEGMWAGGGPLVRELQANYVLYWDMMRDACLRGCTRFHLGRSTSDSGAEDFKKKWNADSEQLHWYYFRPAGGEQPALGVDNPKFQLAIKAWRKMPQWATRLVGPPIAKYIP